MTTSTARDRFLLAVEETARETPGIAGAFRAVDRGDFVPDFFVPDPGAGRTWPVRWKHFSRADDEAWAEQVYSLRTALVTKFGPDDLPSSSSTDPLVMIVMLAAAAPDRGDRVLEIGAGTGYNAAILAHLVGPAGRVISIDIDEELCATVRDRLAGQGNVTVCPADGQAGFPAGAPYDAILVTANAVRLEAAWIAQLAEGGRVAVNLGGPMMNGMFAGTKSADGVIAGAFLDLPQVGFIPLHGHRPQARFDDAAIAAEREAAAADVPPEFATALIGDEDALAFLQLAVPARRSIYEVVGRGERRVIAGFRRDDEQCWVHPREPPAQAARAHFTGGDGLLADLLDAHARWVAAGSPGKASLGLAIGAGGTAVSVAGRPVFVSPVFAPAVKPA